MEYTKKALKERNFGHLGGKCMEHNCARRCEAKAMVQVEVEARSQMKPKWSQT